MKRKTLIFLIIVLLIVLILIFAGIFYLYLREGGSLAASEEGSVEVYFCPQDNCDKVFIDFIKNSRKSVHCAIYEISLDNVTSVFAEKDRLMDVSVLVDDETFEAGHDFFHPIKRSGIMHNKFCIVDGNITLTGSFNPTTTADENDNNILIIRSKSIAKNYENAFSKISSLQRPRALKNTVKMQNLTLKNYFCPADGCEERVVYELSKANESIYFMTFSFTSDAIGKKVIAKHDSGLTVKGIFEKSQLSEYSEYDRMKNSSMDVIVDNNPKSMHNKVFIIDNRTVITGSFNPSRNADENNDENIIVIKNEDIAREYAGYFMQLYDEYEN